MNNTITTWLEILFWLSLFLVFYTHLGYGILLYMLVKLKELFVKPVRRQLPPDKRLPDVTLFITAFNEEEVVDEKMRNCLGLDYPADKLHIVWTTDGSNDSTNQRLEDWPQATVHFQPLRGIFSARTSGENGGVESRDRIRRNVAGGVYRCQYDAQPRSDTRNSPGF